ncbi:MAG: type II secretion system F family protein [Patescibacteria group bacterium]
MLYSYRAVDQHGRPATGEREVASERELADILRREGLILLDDESPSERRGRRRLAERVGLHWNRVSLVERMVFARNLAVMIGAGLPLARALEALAAQAAKAKWGAILLSIRDGILKGQSFAESLKPHENIFGTLFINMVESGEISGNLERVLKILAVQMKRDHDLRAKVRGALMYPAVVVGALVVIGVLMMVYVVPVLTQTFQELGVELPVTTRFIISSSAILLAFYWYFLAAAVIGILALIRVAKLPRVKRAFDILILRTPVFGALILKLNAARFSRTLSSLIASGIPITRALEVTASVVGNSQFTSTLHTAALAIQKGKPLSEILRGRPDIFSPMTVEMIHVGEETGTITKMLLRLALFYEEEVSNTTKNLSSIIEPLLMIIVGAVVGFFAISMIQPIYGSLGNL